MLFVQLHFPLPNFQNSSFISNLYIGDDGNLHKVQGGADTVLPFSSCKIYYVASSQAYVYPFIVNYNLTFIPNYQSLTTNDFIFRNIGIQQRNGGNSWSEYMGITYNASTGIASIKTSASGVGLEYGVLLFDFYVIPGFSSYVINK